jgi:3-isopropylmalate/(R)-2-methylmalate dehydratase small subunit
MKDMMRGKCWVFGDDIPIDGGIMDLKYLVEQVHDPQELAKHCLERLNPEFPQMAKPNDFVVAGRRFGFGNPHIQGFLGLKGLGVGVLADSMPRGAVRCAVNAGLYFLPQCQGIGKIVKAGDELEVDFSTGKIQNRTTGAQFQVEPLPAIILEIIRADGGKGYLRQIFAQPKA